MLALICSPEYLRAIARFELFLMAPERVEPSEFRASLLAPTSPYFKDRLDAVMGSNAPLAVRISRLLGELDLGIALQFA